MSATRLITVRSMTVAGLVASLVMFGVAPVHASGAQQPPVGAWVGAVPEGQTNVIVKLTLKSAELGSRDGRMRVGTPHDCSLLTEYAGMNSGAYVLNIYSSNGPWCDLFRHGTLALRWDKDDIDFALKDKQGKRVFSGGLKPAAH